MIMRSAARENCKSVLSERDDGDRARSREEVRVLEQFAKAEM